MDDQFLLTLYQKQAKMIYHYLVKNGCSHEDAEDIVQESYTKFIRYRNSVAPEKALAYIFTIAMNEFKKTFKQQGKEQTLSIDHELFWHNLSHDEEIEQLVLHSEMKRDIQYTLNQLTETYRQLLVLKYELDFSYKEIALLLGMKIETVRTYLFRARKTFQQLWRDLYESLE